MMLATLFLIELKELQAKSTSLENTTTQDTRVQDTRVQDTHAQDKREDQTTTDMHINDTSVSATSVSDTSVNDLGTYGETFPIQEKSLLEVIKSKLKALADSGKLEDHQKAIANKAKEQLNRPTPVREVTKTITPRSFAYDPSITVPYDLKDHERRVFHGKGTTINPLDTHSLKCPLLFVDGDDAQQVAWAITQHQRAEPFRKPKIILIQGAPLELSKKLNLPIYFDQSSVLVKKLGITQIPARVSQQDKVLLIEEVDPPREEKAELGLSDPREAK